MDGPAFLDRETTQAWLLLSATPGLARHLPAIREALGSPLDLWSLAPSQRRALGLPAKACRWLAQPDPTRVAPTERWLEARADARRLITCESPAYPPLLQHIADPPLLLLGEGPPTGLAQPMFAIVGARRATAAGAALAARFAAHLASAGFCVVSGLAHGIDGASHRGALEAGGRTVAVLATGPDRIYPQDHAALGTQIAHSGQLVSEFLPGTPALKHHFPQRNRIIAGACVATLVVEAAERSGSLITARLAAEAGREVFALPGSVLNPVTAGCHQLLRDGATLVERPEHILDALPGWLEAVTEAPASGSRTPHSRSGCLDTLPSQTRKVLDKLGYDPTTIEQIQRQCGLTAQGVCSILAALEIEGVVRRQEDGRYSLLPHQDHDRDEGRRARRPDVPVRSLPRRRPAT